MQDATKALHIAVADVFGNEDRIITKPLSSEGRAAVRAQLPWATDAEIDGVYWFRDRLRNEGTRW